jgi:predicted metal-binding membrane protein
MALSIAKFPSRNSMPSARQLPRRDFWAIVLSLGGVTLLAWLYLLSLDATMSTSMKGGMDAMRLQAWDFRYFLTMFLMWAVMMIGMMAPSVIPTVLIYASVARKSSAQGTPVAPTGAFVSGYIVMWVFFSLFATLLQWGLEKAVLLSPMMVFNSVGLGAGLLIAAGIYQWLPIKDKCLTQCRSPVGFISHHWRDGTLGAFGMGLSHGAFCLGCCWVLMSLLFVGGVMNLLWIAAITVFVLLEKILPLGDKGGRVMGLLMVATGVVIALLGL